MANEFSWKKCIFCQGEDIEDLRCPVHSIIKNQANASLRQLCFDIEFAVDKNQSPLYISFFNDGTGMENTLRKNSARFHKGCRLNFYRSRI